MNQIKTNQWKWALFFIAFPVIKFVIVINLQIEFPDFILVGESIYFFFIFIPAIFIFLVLNTMFNANKKEKKSLVILSVIMVLCWLMYLFYELTVKESFV